VYPRKGLTVRLACVKHAASVRPEPGSNSPNKNPSPNEAEFESEQSDQSNQSKLAKKQRHAPKRENADTTKKQQTKTTKHTIEFSNNKPRPPARQARGFWPRTRSADGQEPAEAGTSLWDAVALSG
jgi:hypothetical protein